MAKILYIHPETPQPRLLQQIINEIENDGVVVIPTDSGYALATALGNKKGQDRIGEIRQLEKGHFFSLLCHNLSEISKYAKVDNQQYRLLKAITPGAFTCILKASQEIPKRIFSCKRKTIGIRVPDNKIVQELLEKYDNPILITTLILPNEEISEMYPEEIYEKISTRVDLIVDGGVINFEPTTVIDMSEQMPPEIIRQGAGDISKYI